MLQLEIRRRLGALDLASSLSVAPGECLALGGPSGAGKTSLLRSVAGLLRPDRGRITCGGVDWFDSERNLDLSPERRRCGFVFQDYALFPHLSAWRNVAYPIRNVPRAERRRRALEALEPFGMAARADALPRELSGGERQRVAVARALACAPRVLLLDEPLSALDPSTRGTATRELLRVLRSTEVPSILVTHDFADAALLADRVAVMAAGQIVQSGTPGEIASAPVSAFVADFSGAVILTGTAQLGEDGLTLIDLDGGGRVVSTAPASGRVAATVYPWEVALEPHGTPAAGSARNHLECQIVSVTRLGNRVRVGLEAPQVLTAELTEASASQLGLRPGDHVAAVWKAAGTRLLPLEE